MRIELKGITLAVEDHGQGLPVVLLHGFPLAKEVWNSIRVAFAQECRLVTPDLRGFGEADAPEGGYEIDRLADEVIAVADHLGLEWFVIGGHSMGGYVAQSVAVRYPARVIGLILIGSKAEPDGTDVIERRNAAVAMIRSQGGQCYLDAFFPQLVGEATRQRASRLLQELRELARPVKDHVSIACQKAMRHRSDNGDALVKLAVPTICLIGDEDHFWSIKAAFDLAHAMKDACVVTIPSCGHSPMVERPIVTAEALSSFLDGLKRKERRAPGN